MKERQKHKLADTFALLSGLSALRLLSADVWALAVTPGPVFLAVSSRPSDRRAVRR